MFQSPFHLCHAAADGVTIQNAEDEKEVDVEFRPLFMIVICVNEGLRLIATAHGSSTMSGRVVSFAAEVLRRAAPNVDHEFSDQISDIPLRSIRKCM